MMAQWPWAEIPPNRGIAESHTGRRPARAAPAPQVLKMKKITCEKCGARIDPRGYRSHVDSYGCLLQADLNYAHDHGLISAGNYAPALERAGVKVERLYSSLSAGHRGKRAKLHISSYAPAWAVEAYSRLRRSRYSVVDAAALVARGKDDPDLLAALAMEVLKK